MGNLAELTFRTSYHRGRDDIAEMFYLPCMRRASQYDRAVGYFRSTAFVIAWPALRDFVQRGGIMRVLCSQILSDADIEALEQGYSARVDDVLALRMSEEVKSVLRDEVLGQPARVLAALVAQRTLDLKIVVLRETELRAAKGRIFHDKLGIFRDDLGNSLIFKGSMNETWTGLATDGNIESVDVAASWMGARDLERTRYEEKYFDELWANEYPTVNVRPFPEVARAELESAAPADFDSALEVILTDSRSSPRPDARGRTLLPHQAAGLASWAANRRHGILEFATGSGKTFTAITAIRDTLQQRAEPILVVVPDQVLFSQWHNEIMQTTRDIDPLVLRAGAGHDSWRDNLRIWTEAGERPRIVLATLQTAAMDDFRQRLARASNIMLVADEVHRLGSPWNRNLLDEQCFGARLGLSATPERAGDPSGTSALLTFFGGILEPRYSLADAVRDGVLCRYFYRPHTVRLSDHEIAEWRVLANEIGRLRGRLMRGDSTLGIEERLKRLLIARARIVKHAAGKQPLAVEVLSHEYKAGQRWIVYCDDYAQLNAISQSLLQAGIENMPFHSQMEGDRGETLRWLDRRGGVVVAIKCLDEGVDVPSVSHALILASSKNPREFIQRRGRVLRKAPGKSLAYVHDAIVLPPPIPLGEDRTPDPITAGELARAVCFAESADNPASAADLLQVAISAGIEWRSLINIGSEDEED